MSGPLVTNPPQLPAGRYRLEIHVVGPLAAEVSLAHPCHVLHAAPFVNRADQPRVRPVGAAPNGPAGTPMHLLLVLAIPVPEGPEEADQVTPAGEQLALDS